MADGDRHADLPGKDHRRMSIREFREAGYLQEANRRFFHPLGLALELGGQKLDDTPRVETRRIAMAAEGVTWLQWLIGRALEVGLITPSDADNVLKTLNDADVLEPGDLWLSGVWDDRQDPEGIYFAPTADGGQERRRKQARVDAELEQRAEARMAALGYIVQPFPDPEESDV